MTKVFVNIKHGLYHFVGVYNDSVVAGLKKKVIADMIQLLLKVKNVKLTLKWNETFTSLLTVVNVLIT